MNHESTHLVASKGARFTNFIIDSVLVRFGIGIIIATILPYDILGYVLFGLYFFLCETYTGRTLGKLVTKTKVVAIGGSNPTAKQIVYRTFSRFIPFNALTFLMGDRPFGWHDSISGTLVVPVTYTVANVKAIDIAALKKDTKVTKGLWILMGILTFIFVALLTIAAIFDSTVQDTAPASGSTPTEQSVNFGA